MEKRILLVFACAELPVTAIRSVTPPLGVGHIAGALLRAGHRVEIIDQQVQPELDPCRDPDFDFIGISALTPYFPNACALVRRLKEAGFKGKVILGGAHIAALPERALRESGADYVCVGEGEDLMVKLAAGEPPESVPGLGLLAGGEYRQLPAADGGPLDAYAPPALHLFDLPRYGSYNLAIVPPGTRDGVIMTSRGCPYGCDFCFKLSRRIRFLSPAAVSAEIGRQRREFGFAKFSFVDDCFNADMNRAKEICRLLAKEQPGITFTLPNGIRANLIDDELAGLMRAAGCIGANIGVEAWDDEVRAKMDKHLSREQAMAAVRTLRRHGIICTAYFIMGHYHDTAASLRRDIDAVGELDADFFQFSKFLPMPGSRIYNRLVAEGRVKDQDFAKYSIFGEATLMEHPSLPGEEIDAAIRKAYRRAALRPRTLLVLLKKPVIILNVLRNLGQVARLTKLLPAGKDAK